MGFSMNDFNIERPMNLSTTLSVYEGLRPYMPASAPRQPTHADRLRDLLSHFDALLLDGYGVLNIGGEAVPGAAEMLTMAKDLGVEAMVLTNGASKPTQVTWAKYQDLGFDFTPSQIVSSRDALMAFLDDPQSGLETLGVVDSFTEGVVPQGVTARPLSPTAPQDWQHVDAIGFFGAVHWDQSWQDCLIAAMVKGVPVLVANPDVAAPHETAYSREPGFWAAAAAHQLNAYDRVKWFGKPHAPVFDLALKRLEEYTGRSNWNRDRIAMVGDSLHTDILGGQAKGLKTVLITGHGLFRDGGGDQAMADTGIVPDYITASV